MRISQTPVLKLTARKLTSLLQREAIESKEMANILYAQKLRDNVSRKFVQRLFADKFDAQGHLTDKTQRQLKQALKILHLDENATVKTFAEKLLSKDLKFDIKFSEKEISELQKVL